jgi:hypothetical protein
MLQKKMKGGDLGQVRNSSFSSVFSFSFFFMNFHKLFMVPLHFFFQFPTAMASSITVQNLELAGHISSETYFLDQRSSNVFCKGLDN